MPGINNILGPHVPAVQQDFLQLSQPQEARKSALWGKALCLPPLWQEVQLQKQSEGKVTFSPLFKK